MATTKEVLLLELEGERIEARRAVAKIVRSLSQVVKESRGEITPAAQPLIEQLLARPDLLTVLTRPDAPAGAGRSRAVHGESVDWLYYDTEVCVSVGRTKPEAAPAHDHGGWQVFSIYQGSMEYIGYKQLPGSRRGEAILEVLDHRTLRAGDAIKVGVPPEDVHEWRPLEPDTYVLGVLPMSYSNVRRYFRGLELGKQLESGSRVTRRYFDRSTSLV